MLCWRSVPRVSVHTSFAVAVAKTDNKQIQQTRFRARGTGFRFFEWCSNHLIKSVVARCFGAGDGAATFHWSVGVPADESTASRHTVPRLQTVLNCP